ncbi:hypothetical protein M8S83_15365 [Enterobacter asburiae]|uniref:hypothetical protein n=1 Tax=Enterobacter asburiae TaxID=61645 RepID=UPI002075F312|nr:hypothetical protein [Enterobacter asburiae]MCM7773482.1 hypothetical protein [Enterobacter asburiae]
MSSWKDVTGFAAVKVTRHDGSQTGKIYANGLNQTEIVVYFEPTDVNGKLVTGLTSDDYLGPMALIDATTDAKLDWQQWNTSSQWAYTDVKHDYYYPAPDNQSVADITEGGYSFTFYVSCSADATYKNMGIAVQFALADGSTYSTGDSSQHASKTTVNALEPLTYSVNYTSGSPGTNDSLGIRVTRIASKVLHGDEAWVDAYSVTITHPENKNGYFVFKHLTVDSSYNYFSDSETYAIGVSLDGQRGTIHTVFADDAPYGEYVTYAWGPDAVIGSYTDNPAADRGVAMNATVMFINDTDDETPMHYWLDYYSHWDFKDQYGNSGVVYSWPLDNSEGSGNGDINNPKLNFTTSKPS